MKQLLYTIAVVTLFVSACAKKNNSPASTTDPNKVSLSISKVNTPITSYEPGGYDVYFALTNGKIFYGNPSNTTVNQFLISYDIAANIFSGNLAISDNLCACGYGGTLTGDGTNLYYVANDATMYDVTSNSWKSLAYPASARTGEAATAYYNNKLYFAGGRNNAHIFNYYDITNNTWYTLPDLPYNATGGPAMVGYDNKLFIMGGNGLKSMAKFDLTTNAWTQLKDFPFDFSNYQKNILAVYKNFIFTLQYTNYNYALYVYSPANDTWATTPLSMPDILFYIN